MTSPPVELHVISDSTGETAVRLVHALEAQFPEQDFEEIRHPRVETVDDLHLALNRAKGRPAVIVYTLVHPELRDAARAICRRYKLHYCDLLGHPIEAVARVAGVAAKMTPGARPPLDSAYFKRIAAIEFAVKYDDGVGAGLHDADIVLVGVSRTSKTPLSMYLGYLGYKTANVPVVKGIEPPSALFTIDPTKIVGLTIDAERLREIRKQRARRLGGGERAYAELLEIYAELEEAETLHRRLGCPVIEISDLSIEETAARAIRLDRAAAGRGRDAGARSRPVRPKPPVPLWRWATWWAILAAAVVVFYVLLTPIWMGLRALAWLADFRARRRPGLRAARQVARATARARRGSPDRRRGRAGTRGRARRRRRPRACRAPGGRTRPGSPRRRCRGRSRPAAAAAPARARSRARSA